MLNKAIAVVIPCYKVSTNIIQVVSEVLPYADYIFVIDDCCPEKSGSQVEDFFISENKIKVIYHNKNQGVGGAVKSGFVAALRTNASLIIKLDGDGQMDAKYIPRLASPLFKNKADFTKANRFYNIKELGNMPIIRRIGNIGLSVLTKAASGYWHISDPTNGFVAIQSKTLRRLNIEKLPYGYFFETSLIIQLNIIRAVVIDIPVPAKYGNETSSLSVKKSLLTFPFLLIKSMVSRIFWRYYIYDINAVTIFFSLGIICTISGGSFGIYKWFLGSVQGIIQTPGTVALSFLPVLLGFQMLLQAILLDIIDKPSYLASELIDDEIDI